MKPIACVAAALVVIVGGYAWAQKAREGLDVGACEAHIRASLPPGVDYRRLDVARTDSGPLGIAAFREQAGTAASVHGLGEAEDLQNQVDEYWAKSGKLALRTMVVTYRRGDDVRPRQQICAFRLVEGDLETPSTLMSHATTETPKALDLLADLQHRRRQSRPKHSCCL